MYSSTMDELFSLYALLSVGGKIIIDDWYPQHSATHRSTVPHASRTTPLLSVGSKIILDDL
jgi:hypothetical protein